MNIVNRVKNIITDPKVEWEKIDMESDTLQSVITKYVAPLAGIAALCTFIGFSFVAGSSYTGLGIKVALLTFVLLVLSAVITTFVVDALAPNFSSSKNINKSAQLIAYSMTPALIGAFLNVVPDLGIIGRLIGLYGVYLLYLGLGPLKGTPEDKKVVLTLIAALVLIVVYLVLSKILTGIFL